MQLPPNAQGIIAGLTPKDVAQLNARIEQIIEAALKRHMQTVLEEAVKSTPPYAKPNDHKTGGTAAGIKTGRENIRKDVNAIFKTVKSVPFRQLVANRDWEAMAAYDLKFTNPYLEQALANKNINALDAAFQHKFTALANTDMYLSSQQDMQKVHKQIRQARRGGPVQYSGNQKFLVKDKKTISDYVLTVSRSIGKMVYGWYDAAKQLGSSSLINPFGNKKTGGVVALKKDKEMSLTVSNPYGDYDKILSSSMDCQKVLNDAAVELEKEVNNEIAMLVSAYMQGQQGGQSGMTQGKPQATPVRSAGGKKP